MSWAKAGFTYVALLLGLLLVVQFFLAGYGIAELGHHGLKTHETVGHIMLGVSLVMIVVGFLWMKKVVTIDV